MTQPSKADSQTKTCTTEGCDKALRARGLCATHYNQHHQPNRHRKVTFLCAHCGAPSEKYEDNRRPLRFCTLVCRDAWRLEESIRRARKHLAARSQLVHVGESWGHCPLPARHPALLHARRPRRFTEGPCAWCDQRFTIVDQRSSLYCSRKCSRAAAKARYGRFSIRPDLRVAIYERDEWTCQLCMAPVDPTLPQEHAWAATLDHIECQSWALIPDDSPSNLRLAHRRCNSARSDGTRKAA